MLNHLMFTPAEDRKSVRVSLKDDAPPATDWSLTDVEMMLKALRSLRVLLEPGVHSEFPPRQRAEGVIEPNWSTEPELLTGRSILHLREPGYGWLHFVLPRADARRLAAELNAHADAPDAMENPGPKH